MASALVGLAVGSEGGIGDERVSISVLTHSYNCFPRSEARTAYTFPRAAGLALLLSSSEEVDVESVEDVLPSHSPQYE